VDFYSVFHTLMVQRSIAPLYSKPSEVQLVFLHQLSPPPPQKVDLQAQVARLGPFFWLLIGRAQGGKWQPKKKQHLRR
jgi:hypothetical protein